MQNKTSVDLNTTAEYLKDIMKARGMTQRELALKIGFPYQNLSAVIKGKRTIPISTSIRIDIQLGLEAGTLARKQTEDAIRSEYKKMNVNIISDKKQQILLKVKENGGLWSYNAIPKSIPEDDIIEEALRHLEFEDMHIIFEIWSKAHIKRVWRERLVSEGKRMNIINTLLGILFFDIKDIDKYLERNGS